MNAFINACSRRGAMLCRHKRNNKANFTCPFHGWTFNNSGKLLKVKDGGASAGYPEQFNTDGSHDLMMSDVFGTVEDFDIAEAAGISLYGGCLLESSIGAAAHLHAFAGLRELTWGCEHFGPQILVDDLVTEPLHFADFHIHMPAGPGIGVVLDHDKLRHFARG